ncbi:MAG: hypothetical protein U5N55_11795 [Cypionkella sp.]|nr:hypothetical protein [Cypionkella sp.]
MTDCRTFYLLLWVNEEAAVGGRRFAGRHVTKDLAYQWAYGETSVLYKFKPLAGNPARNDLFAGSIQLAVITRLGARLVQSLSCLSQRFPRLQSSVGWEQATITANRGG